MSRSSFADRLNWLRAGVLGANDGIVSVAAIVIGVAGAGVSITPILIAGLAALIGGAISMALGEYVSVSSQRDSIQAAGVSTESLPNAWHAALASAVSFLSGGVIPLAAILLIPGGFAIAGTFLISLIALAIAGSVAAHLGGGNRLRAAIRVVVGGALALGATLLIGVIFGNFGI